jgi:hypothetical protein
VVPEAALLGRPVVALVTREGDETVLRHLVHLQAVGLGGLVASEGHVTFEMYAEQSEELFPSDAGQSLLQSTSPSGQAKVFSHTRLYSFSSLFVQDVLRVGHPAEA